MIRMTMTESDAAIRANEEMTEKVQVQKGVRQGDALSALFVGLSLGEESKKIQGPSH